jgi:hypothetical protein
MIDKRSSKRPPKMSLFKKETNSYFITEKLFYVAKLKINGIFLIYKNKRI